MHWVSSFLSLCLICLIDAVFTLLSSFCSETFFSTRPVCVVFMYLLFLSMKFIIYKKKDIIVEVSHVTN